MFRFYEREIEKFALSQLFAGKISRDLAVIYKTVIYPDVVDRQLARVLPSVLKSNCITVKDSRIRYVIVRHEELTTEDCLSFDRADRYVLFFPAAIS